MLARGKDKRFGVWGKKENGKSNYNFYCKFEVKKIEIKISNFVLQN